MHEAVHDDDAGAEQKSIRTNELILLSSVEFV